MTWTNNSIQSLSTTKTLTNNTATAIANLTTATNSSSAGIVRYAVEVYDGTNTHMQVEVGLVMFYVVNKAGVIFSNTATKSGNIQSATAGSLTVTWAVTTAIPPVLTVNANSSLTVSSGYPKVTYEIVNMTSQVMVGQ